MDMEPVFKLYHNPARQVKVRIYWKPTFMEYLVRKFGINREFSMKQAEDFFKYYLSKNATRHRILRLTKGKWLKRELKEMYEKGLKRKVYVYSFKEESKRYYFHWGGFDASNDSPLMKKIPA